jgi:chaperonin GroEL
LKAEGDVKIGLDILKRALSAPIKQIAQNAGQDGAVVAAEVKANKGNYGYDARMNEYGDLLAKGIVDPTKVTRSALQNAASAAGLFLTTEVAIVDLPEEKSSGGGMGGGMPGMGGMGGMM